MAIMYDENENKFDVAEDESNAAFGYIDDDFDLDDFGLEVTTLQDFPEGTWQ